MVAFAEECLSMRAQKADVYDKQGVLPWPGQSATVHYLPRRYLDLADLEFSEHGRDPRFLPGWWLLPALLLSSTCIAGIASLLI